MTFIAKRVDGAPLIGNTEGVCHLHSSDSRLTNITDALQAAAGGSLPDPTDTTHTPIPVDHVSLGVPLDKPRKLWGIGLNYYEHASDLDEKHPEEPASFMKPATSVAGPGGPIRLPPQELTKHVTAEAELGVVVGRQCYDVSLAQVDQVIAGYVPIIDMTAEDILRRNPRFLTRAKSFDSFMIIGPWIVTQQQVGSPQNITVKTIVNGQTMAKNTVDNMALGPRELVAYHSRVMTLEPGDLISTGTPGAHKIEPGDTVTASIDQVGELSAPVV